MASLLERDFIQGNILDQVDALERRIRILEETILRPSGIVAARYTTDAGQSFSHASLDIVDFEDLVYDSHDAVTTGASWKFTAPLTKWYHVLVKVSFESTTAWHENEASRIHLYKNGSEVSELNRVTGQDFSATAGQNKSILGVDDIYLLAGETIDFRLLQASGVTLSLATSGVSNFVAIHSLG